MKLKNEDLQTLYFYSKLGKKIGKQNLLLYRWTLNKKFKRPLSVTPAIEKIKFLYNIKKLKFDNKEEDDDDNINNIFSIEEKEKQRLEQFEDDIDDRKIYKQFKDEEKEEKPKQKKLGFESHKYFFYKKKENKNKIEPSCTKYNPKYEAILKRSASSPSWKSMQGRKDNTKRDNFPFYIKQDLIQKHMAGKSFIDFSKQSGRNNSIFDKEEFDMIEFSKISKNKSLFNSKVENNKNHRNQSPMNISGYKSTKNSKIQRPISATKRNKNQPDNFSNVSETNNSKDSFDLFRHIYTKKINKKKKKRESITDKTERKIKSIDFDQIISREDLEESKNKEISIVPYLFPNFSLVRDRPIMMVVYDRKKHKKYKRNSEMESIQYNTLNYDKNKKEVHSPHFDLMKARPYDEKDPYPSYMRGVFNKNACFKISGESLKENHYNKSGFIMPPSSFWKNNSFNKYINLKMLKSQSHLLNSFMNNEKVEPRTRRLMKFYNKNYKYLMQGKSKYSDLENDINTEMKKHKNKSIKDLIKDLKKKN